MAWRKSRDGVFEVSTDQKTYRPGDTAKLTDVVFVVKGDRVSQGGWPEIRVCGELIGGAGEGVAKSEHAEVWTRYVRYEPQMRSMTRQKPLRQPVPWTLAGFSSTSGSSPAR